MSLTPAILASFAQNADTAAHVATVVATVVLGLWAYSRFVAQQITRPPIEFTVKGEPVVIVAGKRLIRLTFRVRNASTRECDAWLSWKLQGIRADQKEISGRRCEDGLSQVKFERIYPAPQSNHGEKDARSALSQNPEPGSGSGEPKRTQKWEASLPRPNFIPVLRDPKNPGRNYTTFVGAGVTQEYTIVTAVDLDYSAARILGSINYRRSRSWLARLMTPLARLLSGVSKRETTPLTFNHTVAGVVVLREPEPEAAGARGRGVEPNA